MFVKGVKNTYWRKDSLFNEWYQKNLDIYMQTSDTGTL